MIINHNLKKGILQTHTCDRVAMPTTGDLYIFGWRFGLVTGDFLSTYLMRVFIVY